MCAREERSPSDLQNTCVKNRLTGEAELAAGLNEQVIKISLHLEHIRGEKRVRFHYFQLLSILGLVVEFIGIIFDAYHG